MEKMTCGQIVVKSLRQHAVDTIFVLPGAQLDHLFNALYDEGGSIKVIQTRHEQATAYMAFGYAKSTGRIGVFAVVPGPGFLNTTAALSTGYACNAPMLLVSGQIPLSRIGMGVGMLHEIPDQLAMIRGVTKWADRINHPVEAPRKVREAFKQLSTGRIRPVGLEIPMDVMAMEAYVPFNDSPVGQEQPDPDPDLIEEAARLLGQAKNPMILVGGGIFGAESELLELAETLQAPVVMTRNAFGAINSRHYLALTEPVGYRLWPEVDVVLAVGTRMQAQIAGEGVLDRWWGIDEDLKIVRMDIDPVEINRVRAPEVGILSDARKGLKALVDRIPAHNRRRKSRQDELTALKAEVEKEFEKFEPQYTFLRIIREELPEDGFFVSEITQVGHVARFAFPVYRPRTYVSSGYQGTLGFGFAAALGVKVGNPGKPVISINGDGGFMYNVQELATAVQHRIAVVAIVFTDGAYGNVKRSQIQRYGGRVIGSDLHNPDFVKLAESFGAAAYRAGTFEELRSAIRKGFEEKGPTLIEVPVGHYDMPNPWHLIMPPPIRPKR
ncbi:MAG: hypothetical protein JRJ29_19025 [Deltaproteobacteria bacterium]|nr:hypothetical protein [Deltaproteobacteria bacterium]